MCLQGRDKDKKLKEHKIRGLSDDLSEQESKRTLVEAKKK